jgi:hypothetical protein
MPVGRLERTEKRFTLTTVKQDRCFPVQFDPRYCRIGSKTRKEDCNAIGHPACVPNQGPFRQRNVLFAAPSQINNANLFLERISTGHCNLRSRRRNAPRQIFWVLQMRSRQFLPLSFHRIELIKAQLILFPEAQDARSGGTRWAINAPNGSLILSVRLGDLSGVDSQYTPEHLDSV